MSTKRSTRRAAIIDVVDSTPKKQRKTKRLQRDSFSEMNNSNPELESSTLHEGENEIENSNSQNTHADEDEELTQPLFPVADPNDLIAQADILLAEMNAHLFETALRQNADPVVENISDSGIETKPTINAITENNDTTRAASNEQSPKREQVTGFNRRSANNGLQSASTSNQSQNDDSVILIDDVAMPLPNRGDEDVIFVESYVKQPRITSVVDLCGDDDDASVQKCKATPVMPSTEQASASGAQIPTSPVASTSNNIVVKCPICLDIVPNEEVHSTICGHLYCHPCIDNIARTRKKCPMCNAKIAVKQIHRIYFQN